MTKEQSREGMLTRGQKTKTGHKNPEKCKKEQRTGPS
jgi:hypothetical protein